MGVVLQSRKPGAGESLRYACVVEREHFTVHLKLDISSSHSCGQVLAKNLVRAHSLRLSNTRCYGDDLGGSIIRSRVTQDARLAVDGDKPPKISANSFACCAANLGVTRKDATRCGVLGTTWAIRYVLKLVLGVAKVPSFHHNRLAAVGTGVDHALDTIDFWGVVLGRTDDRSLAIDLHNPVVTLTSSFSSEAKNFGVVLHHRAVAGSVCD
mmetsp:Transcript_13170/g.24149  ORF Transcript_13170/g.24149 Transcript_13170/m.24149 type:complete len:211 (+) Transcript_13170:2041-2673(+)